MSYVANSLISGEQIVYEATVYKHYGWTILAVFMALCAVIGVSNANTQSISAALAFVALAALCEIYRRAAIKNTEFAITNKRVIAKTGVLSHRSVELLLGKVEGITFTKSLFKYGSISISGTGNTKETFTGIMNPDAFVKAFRETVDSNQ